MQSPQTIVARDFIPALQESLQGTGTEEIFAFMAHMSLLAKQVDRCSAAKHRPLMLEASLEKKSMRKSSLS